MQGGENLQVAIMSRLQMGMLVQCTPYATLHGGPEQGPHKPKHRSYMDPPLLQSYSGGEGVARVSGYCAC